MQLLFGVIFLAFVAPGLSQKWTHANMQRFKNDFVFPNNPVVQTTKTTTEKVITQKSTSCIGPNFEFEGFCIRLDDCEPLKTRLLKNPSDATFISELKRSNVICDNAYAVVCCPSPMSEQLTQLPLFPENRNDIPRKLPLMEDGCGYRKESDILTTQVVGGVTSEIGAWPWIALIGYGDSRSASAFKCGGALITSRHVLTAAHCIKSSLTFVRLGEHDLSTNAETNHIDVRVSNILKHPKYNPKDGHSDIAMLYLDQNVQFSPKITPICLPLMPDLKKKSFVNQRPFVAGWGRTMEGGKPAKVLQELIIPVYNNSVCKDLYRKQNKLISQQQFNNAVMCAGDLSGGKDTCQGDSGGPLMIPEQFGDTKRFHLIGVVSYGIGCARPDTPGVYTRVTHFMDWIQSAVKNQNLL